MAMPARYRETLGERSDGRLVATVDRGDRCLLIYPLTDWEEIERMINSSYRLIAPKRTLAQLDALQQGKGIARKRKSAKKNC